MDAIKNLFCCSHPSRKPSEENPNSETTPLHRDSTQSRNNYTNETPHQYHQSEPIPVAPPEPRDSHDNDHPSTALQLGYSSDTSCSVSMSSDSQRVEYRMHKTELLRSKKPHRRLNVVNEGISPELQCFIIPSFGKDPPDNVAVKKMAGDFLKGVGDDFDIIQHLIKSDGHKYIYQVDFMCHFAQKKVAVFKKAIGDAMKDLRLQRTQKGCKYCA